MHGAIFKVPHLESVKGGRDAQCSAFCCPHKIFSLHFKATYPSPGARQLSTSQARSTGPALAPACAGGCYRCRDEYMGLSAGLSMPRALGGFAAWAGGCPALLASFFHRLLELAALPEGALE